MHMIFADTHHFSRCSLSATDPGDKEIIGRGNRKDGGDTKVRAVTYYAAAAHGMPTAKRGRCSGRIVDDMKRSKAMSIFLCSPMVKEGSDRVLLP